MTSTELHRRCPFLTRRGADTVRRKLRPGAELSIEQFAIAGGINVTQALAVMYAVEELHGGAVYIEGFHYCFPDVRSFIVRFGESLPALPEECSVCGEQVHGWAEFRFGMVLIVSPDGGAT